MLKESLIIQFDLLDEIPFNQKMIITEVSVINVCSSMRIFLGPLNVRNLIVK